MTTSDDLFSIPEEIRERICIHRGLFESEEEENTAGAIRDAVELNPYFVEFDIQKYNGDFFSGHPPAIVTEDDGKLENILGVYSEHARQVQANGQNFKRFTFPKIDLKLNGEDPKKVINELVAILEDHRYKDIPFYLINIGRAKGKKYCECLLYFDSCVSDSKERYGLNVDLEKFGAYSEIGGVNKLRALFSASPEINSPYTYTGKNFFDFVKRHKIGEVHFWLRGPPDNPNPAVYLNTLRYALEWGKSNHLTVYFDINPMYIENGTVEQGKELPLKNF